jgi:N-acylneuraminate cytidylyltransferase
VIGSAALRRPGTKRILELAGGTALELSALVVVWEIGVSLSPLLAVIPARGGSKGLPGKNIAILAGLPLIAHSIRLASLCPEISRCIVSTDSEEIAAVAQAYGADVPFLRPSKLAQDDTPMWPVLQHALRETERRHKMRFESLLLLQPTNPGRLPQDISGAVRILNADPKAMGVIAVSEPSFNPRWSCLEECDGYIKTLFPEATQHEHRQAIPTVYRINGLLYLWRRDHVLNATSPLYDGVPHLVLVVPEIRAADVDTAQDLAMIELLIREGMIQLPWLDSLRG